MAHDDNLYSLVFPAPRLGGTEDTGPVLVHGLEGFSDAGHVVRLVTDHILAANDAELVARFKADELIDYRSRRPPVTYSFDHFSEYAEPHISLHAVTTAEGRTFLLLSGLEPDMRWEAFAAAITRLAADLGVKLSIGLSSMPLSVPHTRPAGSSSHSADTDLLQGMTTWPGEFRLPGSADSMLEIKLGEQGFRSMGITAHVPHYLAQSDYPASAIRVLEDINKVTGLQLPVAELEHAQAEFTAQLEAQVSGNHELTGMVQQLEQAYDEFMSRRRGPDSLTPGNRPLPTGDEIGAELEQFLAQRGDEPGAPNSPDSTEDSSQDGPAAPGESSEEA